LLGLVFAPDLSGCRYGFIAVVDRPESIFFHFSEVGAGFNPEELGAGSEVEFTPDQDRKSRKNIASNVQVLAPGTIKPYTLGTTVQSGVVVGLARPSRAASGQDRYSHRDSRSRQGSDGFLGQINYKLEDGGSSRIGFPFDAILAPSSDDDGRPMHVGDKVSFQVGADRRDGRTLAREVTIVERAPVDETDGIIKSLKSEGFGFIERADVDKEIFFHLSEFARSDAEPRPGDPVRFEVAKNRTGKPVALRVRALAPGSVTFEEVLPEVRTGVISKPLRKARDRRPNPTSRLGRIIPKCTSEGKEVAAGAAAAPTAGAAAGRGGGAGSDDPAAVAVDATKAAAPNHFVFGESDVSAESPDDSFAISEGDTVSFQVARDKRTGRQHAVNVLVTEKVAVVEETREQGVVQTMKDGFGFIKCADRESRMFFHFSEVHGETRELRNGDHVEFAVEEQQQRSKKTDTRKSDKLHAVRVTVLPRGTVKFEVESTERYVGTVVKAPQLSGNQFGSRRASSGGGAFGSPQRTSSGGSARISPSDSDQGLPQENSGLVDLVDPVTNDTRSLAFQVRDVTDMRSSMLKVGDTIEFTTLTVKRSKTATAINIRVVERAPQSVEPLSARRKAAAPAADDGAHFGFISSIKDAFGFIESPACDSETFFHFSELVNPSEKLRTGDLVTFNKTMRSGKQVAASVQKLDEDRLQAMQHISETTHAGRVARSTKSSSAGDTAYGGLIEYEEAGGEAVACAGAGEATEGLSAEMIHTRLDAALAGGKIAFGNSSLHGGRVNLRVGDEVTFSEATWVVDGSKRAVRVSKRNEKRSNRKKETGRIGSTKQGFGFIEYTVSEEPISLYYHSSSVTDNVPLDPGDEVEFEVTYNNSRQKHNAVNVRLVCRKEDAPVAQRPARLRSILRAGSGGNRKPGDGSFGASRVPTIPDGTRGFAFHRSAAPAPSLAARRTEAVAEQPVGYVPMGGGRDADESVGELNAFAYSGSHDHGGNNPCTNGQNPPPDHLREYLNDKYGQGNLGSYDEMYGTPEGENHFGGGW
jgi:cold shock CspA family protein